MYISLLTKKQKYGRKFNVPSVEKYNYIYFNFNFFHFFAYFRVKHIYVCFNSLLLVDRYINMNLSSSGLVSSFIWFKQFFFC